MYMLASKVWDWRCFVLPVFVIYEISLSVNHFMFCSLSLHERYIDIFDMQSPLSAHNCTTRKTSSHMLVKGPMHLDFTGEPRYTVLYSF